MRSLTIALLCAAPTLALAGEKMPTVEEGANRAALQDQVGNLCPGVVPDYVMRAVLVSNLKSKDPHRWASAYGAATRELVGMLSDDAAIATVCTNALDLYGPKGTSVPRLLKPVGQ